MRLGLAIGFFLLVSVCQVSGETQSPLVAARANYIGGTNAGCLEIASVFSRYPIEISKSATRKAMTKIVEVSKQRSDALLRAVKIDVLRKGPRSSATFERPIEFSMETKSEIFSVKIEPSFEKSAGSIQCAYRLEQK